MTPRQLVEEARRHEAQKAFAAAPKKYQAARRISLEKLRAARKRYQAALRTGDDDARFHARAALRQAEARWGHAWQKERLWSL